MGAALLQRGLSHSFILALHHKDVDAAIKMLRARRSGLPAVKLAFKLLVLTAARSGEIRLTTGHSALHWFIAG